MNRLVPLIVSACLFGMVFSACHFSRKIVEEGTDPQTEDCEHSEFPGWKIKVGSNILTPNCFNITCFPDGMTTCGFGWRLASVIGLPNNCTKVKVGNCGLKFVSVEDESTLCYQDKDLEYNSLVLDN